MVKQRSSLRLVPWQSWTHWNWVATQLFSDAPDNVKAALDRIAAWQSRGKVPLAVESTAALISIHQRDPQVNHDLPRQSAPTEEILKMLYAMAIQRLVNGVVDQSQRHNLSSVASRAKIVGLPRLLVDIRHEAAHKELPGLSLLQFASKQALAWLKLQYWDQQTETLMKARMELKSRLVEHCLLVGDILNPSAVLKDVEPLTDGEEADELLEEKLLEALAVMKQQRGHLFSELLDFALSSTSDLISVLVDDGLLEEDLEQTLGKPCDQPIIGDLTNSLDLVSATDTAWKFTLKELSSRMPRLPGMLLVALIKRINGSHSSKGDASDNYRTGLQESNLSLMPPGTTDGKIKTVTLDSNSRARLVAWCRWLLGKTSSEDSNHLMEQEPLNLKQLKISSTMAVRAGLSKVFLRDLLRMCLRVSNGKRPIVELVPLIAVQLGSERFQNLANALAQLGTGIQRSSTTVDRDDNSATNSTMILEETVDEGPSQEGATPSLSGQKGDSSPHSKSVPDYSGPLQESWIAERELALEIARAQQKAFLERLSSQKNAANTSDGTHSSTEALSDNSGMALSATSPTSRISPVKNTNGQHPSCASPNKGSSDIESWTVVANWQPCAIGMIPSPGHSLGIIPSLELVEDLPEDDFTVDGQTGGTVRMENLQHDPLVIQEDKNSLEVVGAIELSANKRGRNGETPNPSTIGKKSKKTGYHVHFDLQSDNRILLPDTMDTAKPCGTVPEEPSGLIQEGSPEDGTMPKGSLLQGCLLQHGVLVPVPMQQLESLQAAVHVL